MYMKRTLKLWFLCAVFVFCAVAEAEVPPVRVDLDVESGVGKGSSLIFEPADKKGFLCVFSYPNVYGRSTKNIDEVTLQFLYPKGIDKGWMKIGEIHDALGRIGKRVLSEQAGVPFRLKDVTDCFGFDVKDPVPPFKINYSFYVPRMTGPYGRYGRVVTALGGLSPMPVRKKGGVYDFFAPAVKRDLSGSVISCEGNYIVAGKYKKCPDFISSLEAPYIGAVFYGRNYPIKLHIKSSFLSADVFLFNVESKGYIADFRDSLTKLLKRLERGVSSGMLPEGGRRKFVLVEAPLRRRLVLRTTGMLVFSDRMFKVFPALVKYHEKELFRGLVEEYVEPLVYSRESAPSAQWVIEFVSAMAMDEAAAELMGKGRDARRLGPVRVFSFHPAVDQVVYTPQFPFVYAYYDIIYARDPLGHGPLSFNRRIPNGRVLYEKFLDMQGREGVLVLLRDYWGGSSSLIDTAVSRFGDGIGGFFSQWLGPFPRMDYSLESVVKRKVEGGYRTDFTVRRKSDRPIEEPVEVLVKERGNGSRLLRWDGAGNEKKFSLLTRRPVSVIEIDPRHRLSDYNMLNNRVPPEYKWILTAFSFGADLNDMEPYVYAAVQFRKKYGGRHRYNVSAFYSDDAYGVSIGYSLLFGRVIDSLRMTHGAGISYNFSRLNEDTVVYRDFSDPSIWKVMELGESGYATSVTLSYFFGNFVSYMNPIKGWSGGVAATLGNSIFGGDFDYYSLSFGLRTVQPITLNNLLAGRFLISKSGDSGLPMQLYTSLGGINSARGFDSDDVRFDGRNRILLSGEYRGMVIPDTDIDLHLFRLRRVQVVAFADTGRVTGTKEDIIRESVEGVSFRSDFKGLFDISEWDSDIGVGVRFFFDALGVRETLLRFDAARRLQNFGFDDIRYYISFEQSF